MEDNCHLNNLKYSGETRLDLEFRQILCVIKQFIPQVNSAHHLSLYRCWLEKLNTLDCDKSDRNRYLIELAKQIKANVLASPFDQAPREGPLVPYPETEPQPSAEDQQEQRERSTCRREFRGEIHPERRETHPERREVQSEREEGNSDPDRSVFPGIIEERPHPVQCYIRSASPVFIPEGKAVNYYQTVDDNDNYIYYPCPEQFIKEDNNNKEFEAEGSWCDLTDDNSNTSINPRGAGDAKEKYFHHKSMMDESQPEENKNLDGEDKKLPLKETKFIPADWKMTIESLQLRLTETLSQNNELKRLVESLNTQLAFEKNNREQVEAKLKISELYDKEIEIARNTTDDQLKSLQMAYQHEMEQLHESSELKLEEVKASYEMQISHLKLDHETDKREKEKEIKRLSEIIHEQCGKMSDEITSLRKEVEHCITARGNEKINVLQKCISKMDKLFHKSEKEYLKQIEKLKQDLELKEKVQQIQMITQRAEIAARTSAEKQKQVDEIINNLEVKYIKMLEFHEKQVIDGKKKDEERIEYLTGLLKKSNIPFKIF